MFLLLNLIVFWIFECFSDFGLMAPHEQRIRDVIRQKQKDLESRQKYDGGRTTRSRMLDMTMRTNSRFPNIPTDLASSFKSRPPLMNESSFMSRSRSPITKSPTFRSKGGITSQGSFQNEMNTSLARKIAKSVSRTQSSLGHVSLAPQPRIQVVEVFVDGQEHLEGRMDFTVRFLKFFSSTVVLQSSHI